MKKIQINNSIESLADKYSKNAFSIGYINKPKVNLQKLHDRLGIIKHREYRSYLKHIIDNYEEILKAKPSEIVKLNTEFERLLPKKKLSNKIISKKKPFYENVIEEMRYGDVRSKEFLPYLKGLHIKTCVYCHSQLAVIIDHVYYDKKKKKSIKTRKAKLELDHYYPKSLYPHLSTSFYNLFPVCGNCNRAKSDKEIKFQLYSESLEPDLFNFWIDDASIIRYWVSFNHEDLKIYFDNLTGNHELRNEYNEIFAIQGIYDTQKDVAEELVYKAKIYTQTYKDTLFNQFQSLFNHKDILDRLILGNYAKEEDIFKRPMAKFTQDIAKQLGLI